MDVATTTEQSFYYGFEIDFRHHCHQINHSVRILVTSVQNPNHMYMARVDTIHGSHLHLGTILTHLMCMGSCVDKIVKYMLERRVMIDILVSTPPLAGTI